MMSYISSDDSKNDNPVKKQMWGDDSYKPDDVSYKPIKHISAWTKPLFFPKLSETQLQKSKDLEFLLKDSQILTRQKVDNLVKLRKVERSDCEKVDNKFKDNGLEMFCYTGDVAEDDYDSRSVRGAVFKKDKLICQAFFFTPHTTTKTVPEFTFDKCKFYQAFEGSVVRIFFYNNKWWTTTHRKLDARRSFWSSKISFGEYFENALNQLIIKKFLNIEIAHKSHILDRFYSTLDTKYQYSFIVLNQDDNCIASTRTEQYGVYHIGTFNEQFEMVDIDVNVPKPDELKFNSRDELLKYIEKDTSSQGVVVFLPNGQQLKISSESYMNRFNIRGNEPSIKKQYLNLRRDHEATINLKNMYPSYIPDFMEYENIIDIVSKFVYKQYIKRYIHREMARVPKPQYKLLLLAHDSYKKTKNYVTVETIKKIMNYQLTATELNHIIKDYRLQLKKLNEYQP
jgi:hypothetical protein